MVLFAAVETVIAPLPRYRGDDTAAYYSLLLQHALQSIEWLRESGRSVSFVCHRISGLTDIERTVNIFSLADTLSNLNVFTTTIGFNQLWYHADHNSDDPRDFEKKFEVFYPGVIDACDQVLAVNGYQGVRGCETEIAYARATGKPVYLLKTAVSYTQEELRLIGESGVRLAILRGWARAAPGSSLDVPLEQLTPWESLVSPFD